VTPGAIWTLIPVSLIYGLVAALAFRRFADQSSIHASVNRMMAHVMEFRLFLDSPALVLRAQRDLFRENLHLLRLIILPCLILASIFMILFPQLDALYGHAPLKAGERTIVAARLDGDAVLEAPAGIEVETPGVHTIHDRKVSWRVRPLGRTSGELRVHNSGMVLTKRIVAGGGLIYDMRLPFSHPEIEIDYPKTKALGMHWMVWFFVISSVAAMGYKR
jgi:hypothetical protein